MRIRMGGGDVLLEVGYGDGCLWNFRDACTDEEVWVRRTDGCGGGGKGGYWWWVLM